MDAVALILKLAHIGLEAALAAARQADTVTPGLRAAFNDGAVRFARTAEVVVLAVIVVLMVVKPTL